MIIRIVTFSLSIFASLICTLNPCPWGPVANDNGRLICGRGQGGGNFTILILYDDFNFSGRTLQLTGRRPTCAPSTSTGGPPACACRATGTSAAA